MLFCFNGYQRVANMARSRSLALCLLITRMFMLLLICLDSTKAAMGYDLLLWAAFLVFLFYQYSHTNLPINDKFSTPFRLNSILQNHFQKSHEYFLVQLLTKSF